MENGNHNIYIEQWFMFCELTQIPSDSVQYGCIDFLNTITVSNDSVNNGFKIPPKYSYKRASGVRYFLPLISLFKNALGEEKLDEFLKEKKIDRDFFLVSDGILNFNFDLDLFKILIQKQILSEDFLVSLGVNARSGNIHGKLRKDYELIQEPIEVLKKFISNKKFYERNFNYRLDDINQSQLSLAITPVAHMIDFQYRSDQVLGKSLCEYQKLFLKTLTIRDKKKEITITEKECLYKNTKAKQCLYMITR
jgi:hypothetical protein